MIQKAPNAFRTISEVATWLRLPTHVLRFWESKITEITPVKRAGGRRYYRPKDMLFLGGIKHLLHNEGLTIRALNKKILVEGVEGIATYSAPLNLEGLESIKNKTSVSSELNIDVKLNSDKKINKGLDEPQKSDRLEHLLYSKTILKKKLRTVKKLETNDRTALVNLIKRLTQKRNDLAQDLSVESKNKY